MNKTLSGPADIAVPFGSFLIPLAVLEIYLAAQKSSSNFLATGTAGLLLMSTC